MRKRGHATDAKALWRWEKGHNQPNARVIPDLAAVLGSTIDELYGSADDEDESSMPLSRDEYALYGELTARIVAHRLTGTPA